MLQEINVRTKSDLETEQIAFRRLVASIHEAERWEAFCGFVYQELEEQGKKKRRPILASKEKML